VPRFLHNCPLALQGGPPPRPSLEGGGGGERSATATRKKNGGKRECGGPKYREMETKIRIVIEGMIFGERIEINGWNRF
jgi:hypothetical protein